MTEEWAISGSGLDILQPNRRGITRSGKVQRQHQRVLGSNDIRCVRGEIPSVEALVQGAFDGAMWTFSRRGGAVDELQSRAPPLFSEAKGAVSKVESFLDSGAVQVKRHDPTVVV